MKKIGFITGVGGGGGGSTEYTQAEKTKLAGIEAGATVGATAAQAAKLTELEGKVGELSVVNGSLCMTFEHHEE